MTKNEANELRCLAHEIIIKLYAAKQLKALELLRAHTVKAVEELQPPATQTKDVNDE